MIIIHWGPTAWVVAGVINIVGFWLMSRIFFDDLLDLFECLQSWCSREVLLLFRGRYPGESWYLEPVPKSTYSLRGVFFRQALSRIPRLSPFDKVWNSLLT